MKLKPSIGCPPLCCLPSCAFTRISEWGKRSSQSLYQRVSVSERHHKQASPRASSSVRASLMYLKSMQETICLGSWIDTCDMSGYSCDYINLVTNQMSPATHHVDKQLPERLRWKMMTTRCETLKLVEGNGVCLITGDPPFPLVSPTGPTRRSGLQQWPGASLPSLDLTGPHKSVKSVR